MNQVEALQLADQVLLQIEANWPRSGSMRLEVMQVKRKQWSKQLISLTDDSIKQAMDITIASDKQHPPTVGTFCNLAKDMMKQKRMQYTKQIEQKANPEIVRREMENIKAILARTGMKLDLPWLA